MASEAGKEPPANQPFFPRVAVGASFSTASFMPKSLPIRHCALCGTQLTLRPERFWVDDDDKEIELCSYDCAWNYAAKIDPSYGPGEGHALARGLMADPAKMLGFG